MFLRAKYHGVPSPNMEAQPRGWTLHRMYKSIHTDPVQAGTHLESLEAPKSHIFRPAVPGPHRSSPNLTRPPSIPWIRLRLPPSRLYSVYKVTKDRLWPSDASPNPNGFPEISLQGQKLTRLVDERGSTFWGAGSNFCSSWEPVWVEFRCGPWIMSPVPAWAGPVWML